MSIGHGTTISADLTVSNTQISLGQRCFVGYGCFLDGDGTITIGDDCHLAQRVSIHTVTHAVGPRSRRAGHHETRSCVVEDGVWIGAGALVLPGVTIGRGCIIGAGAVVTRDCQPDGVYAGTPAVRVKELS